jgi:hypothetical protein
LAKKLKKKLQQKCVALNKEVGFYEVDEGNAVKLLQKEELSNEKLMQHMKNLVLFLRIQTQIYLIWDLTKDILM